jgi:hypothetical protein
MLREAATDTDMTTVPFTDPSVTLQEDIWSAPKVLSNVDQGDFSNFQNMFNWDAQFLETFGGDPSSNWQDPLP